MSLINFAQKFGYETTGWTICRENLLINDVICDL